MGTVAMCSSKQLDTPSAVETGLEMVRKLGTFVEFSCFVRRRLLIGQSSVTQRNSTSTDLTLVRNDIQWLATARADLMFQFTVSERRYGGQECKYGGGQKRQGISRHVVYAYAIRRKYRDSCS